MSDTRADTRAKENNFGLLRLALATGVIISHSPELIDGNRDRELVFQWTGSVSLGGLAVDGFFLISGYLITKSCVDRGASLEFLVRRLARIVPGYLVSFLICTLAVAPFVAGYTNGFRLPDILKLVSEAVRLLPPSVPGVFPGLPYPSLNGSMWTIAYEVRCYILVLVLGLLGLFGGRSRVLILLIWAALLVALISGVLSGMRADGGRVFGAPELSTRLAMLFVTGACFYLFRNYIKYNGYVALISCILLCLSLRLPLLAEPAIAIFGGYIIFWLAIGIPSSPITGSLNRVDLSYGIYLYAFPIQNILIYGFGISNPWSLTFAATPIAYLSGYASWILVERPALAFSAYCLSSARLKLPVKGLVKSTQGR